jgi:hypothetical protein
MQTDVHLRFEDAGETGTARVDLAAAGAPGSPGLHTYALEDIGLPPVALRRLFAAHRSRSAELLETLR